MGYNKILSLLFILLISACGVEDIDIKDVTLGPERLKDYPDCQQMYFKTKPLTSLYAKKIIGVEGSAIIVIECQGYTVKVDPYTQKLI
jgi:hypothetical protein